MTRPFTDRDVIALWDDGLSAEEIAAALHVGEPHVEAVVAELSGRFDHVPYSPWISSEDWTSDSWESRI